MINIIGFSGRLGSGKDTAAQRLAQIVDIDTQRVAFADKLKESAAAIFGLDTEFWNEHKKDDSVIICIGRNHFEKERDFGVLTAREFLQRYGTEAHRNVFGTDFWVDQALDGVESSLILVTDVRFDNEVQGIHARSGVVVAVKGANDPKLVKGTYTDEWYYEGTTTQVHPSEIPLEGHDYTINNVELDDHYANLDTQLYDLAIKLGLPLREATLA